MVSEPVHPRTTTDTELTLRMVNPPDKTIPIFNLSNHILNDAETLVLNAGLSFVPTHTNDHFNTRIELFRFFHSVRLKHFFSVNEAIPVPNITGLHGPSSFFPPAARSEDVV